MLRLSLLFVLLMGCLGMGKSSIFNTEPYVDTVVDENGKRLSADTPRNWENWAESMHAHIQSEVAGDKASGGLESWNIFWDYRISALKEGRENFQKYINYIIEQRRLAGLPELVFEDNQEP